MATCKWFLSYLIWLPSDTSESNLWKLVYAEFPNHCNDLPYTNKWSSELCMLQSRAKTKADKAPCEDVIKFLNEFSLENWHKLKANNEYEYADHAYDCELQCDHEKYPWLFGPVKHKPSQAKRRKYVIECAKIREAKYGDPVKAAMPNRRGKKPPNSEWYRTQEVAYAKQASDGKFKREFEERCGYDPTPQLNKLQKGASKEHCTPLLAAKLAASQKREREWQERSNRFERKYEEAERLKRANTDFFDVRLHREMGRIMGHKRISHNLASQMRTDLSKQTFDEAKANSKNAPRTTRRGGVCKLPSNFNVTADEIMGGIAALRMKKEAMKRGMWKKVVHKIEQIERRRPTIVECTAV